jgi:hypothetical protein
MEKQNRYCCQCRKTTEHTATPEVLVCLKCGTQRHLKPPAFHETDCRLFARTDWRWK